MNILVIHATAGAGHKKAAEAIYHGLQAKAAIRVQLVDALDYTNPVFKYTYPNCYAFIVSHIPWLWAFVFAVLDQPFLQPAVRIFRRIYNGLNAGKLSAFLKKEQFDCIICTQFLSAEVSAYLKRTGQIKSQIICVVTDFDVHRIWINEGIDDYAGASQYTRDKLIQLGVPPEHTFVTGIPTDPKFRKQYDAVDLRRQWGLNEHALTTLIATGSFGFGPIEELVDLLKGQQLIIVCGHNKGLYDRLSRRKLPLVKVCSLVDNMEELMSAADIMVTKPGGLSIAEALVKGLVLIFFSAIPGQETNNVRVLTQLNVGFGQLPLVDIVQTVGRLQSSKEELTAQQARSKAVGKPLAVEEIIRIISNK